MRPISRGYQHRRPLLHGHGPHRPQPLLLRTLRKDGRIQVNGAKGNTILNRFTHKVDSRIRFYHHNGSWGGGNNCDMTSRGINTRDTGCQKTTIPSPTPFFPTNQPAQGIASSTNTTPRMQPLQRQPSSTMMNGIPPSLTVPTHGNNSTWLQSYRSNHKLHPGRIRQMDSRAKPNLFFFPRHNGYNRT